MESLSLPLGLLPQVMVNGKQVPLFYHWQQMFVENYEGQLIHYTVTAGITFLIFYVLLRGLFLNRKIQAAFPPSSDIRREVFYSLSSLAVFAAVGVFAAILHRLGLTQNYSHIDKYGLALLLLFHRSDDFDSRRLVLLDAPVDALASAFQDRPSRASPQP